MSKKLARKESSGKKITAKSMRKMSTTQTLNGLLVHHALRNGSPTLNAMQVTRY